MGCRSASSCKQFFCLSVVVNNEQAVLALLSPRAEKSLIPVSSRCVEALRRAAPRRAARSFSRFIDYKLHGDQSLNGTGTALSLSRPDVFMNQCEI